MKLKTQNIFFLIINILILMLSFHTSAFGDKPLKVLILPFNIHSDKDLSFLRDGIEDMLSTRLSREGEVIPISREQTRQIIKDLKGPINEKTAISLGQQLNADYVSYGSLTVFGDSISTDARFFDLHKKKNVAMFHEVGKNNSDVIFHINRFANYVNKKIFNIESDIESDIVSDEADEAPTARKTDDSRKHPELLWEEVKKKRHIPDTSEPETDAPAEIPVKTSEKPSDETVSVADSTSDADVLWKSENFNVQIKSMGLGDVDGDGRNETVFIDDRTVFIYRYANQSFEKISEIEGTGFDMFINVELADINGNGKSEIFVTDINQKTDILKSFVLEWDGKAFVPIIEDSRWYYKIIHVPKRGDILLGQKRGIRDIFIGSVSELKWQNGDYVSVKEQVLPLWINVFGFSYGDILNNGKEMIAAFSENEHIRLLSKDGSEEWRSTEPFGGSLAYLNFPIKGSPSVETVLERERRYIPQRLHIADVDKDGKYELIVGKNTDTTRRVFSRLRLFKSGHIECLVWDKVGLYKKWETREINGHISDYVIGDADNDGQNELVFSVVTKIGSVLSDPKSFIVLRKIN